ncbi:hypothetical protein [Ferruginibacter sp. HRS2-29]|uniref:hypothetical protein n=1 Tax=Ferruginibacter sp. HRS2-29 TaxID=2487334 RepID=UPI0020CD0B2F|nr:hypothetical protein [Ferruginibacter sp. HRS2-29]MCP9750173.1 hypothetical protein [Ferruginibacter sp. HRS2-29]
MKTHQQSIHSIQEAYEAIHEFFSCYHLPEALEETDRLFKWACKEKYYKKSAPVDIVFFSQQLYRLFTAAEIINYSTGKKLSVIDHDTAGGKDMPGTCLNQAPCLPRWEEHSRYLNFAEWQTPYWALRKLNGIRQWEEVLEELMEAALSNGSIEGRYKIGDVLKWRERMMGIVEGGWLVEVKRSPSESNI